MSLSSDGVDLTVDHGTVDLDWGFWDAQLEALDALASGEYDVVVFRGGYGSGKSVLGARWSIEQALAVPKSDNLILAQDSAKGAPTTYKVFFEQLPGEDTVPDEGGDPENSPLVADYHRVDRRLTWVNSAITRLGSADKWNRYAGAEFNTAWMDEVAHYENTDIYKLNEMLISRQRTEDGPNVTLWTSTGNGYNQFYDFVERQVDTDGNDLTTRIYNVVANSLDNPFLSEKEKMERQFAGTSREGEALGGGFAAAEGLVYDRFSREHHVVDAADVPGLLRSDWRMYGYDHGWKDPRVLLEIGKTAHDQYLVSDLFYETETTVEDAISWLTHNDKYQGTIYAEHEPDHIAKFERAGYPTTAANKDLDEGIPVVREHLELDRENQPGLLVSDRCAPLVQEFFSYQEDHVGTSKADDHCLDSLRYAIMGDTGGAGDSFLITR